MKKLPVLLLTAVLVSCIPYINDTWDNDKVSTYEYLCDQLENHYVYFDYKNLDFTDIRNNYKNQIDNEMTDEAFYQVLESFIFELEDGHANIFTPFTTSPTYPSFMDGYEKNYDAEVIRDNYLDTNPVYGKSMINSLIERNGSVYGYIYYGSFMNSATVYEIEYILNRFRTAEVKGIILDVRNNGGGVLENPLVLLSYFGGTAPGTKTTVLKGWRRDAKDIYTEINGMDFSIVYSISFDVTSDEKVYRGPVALLTNRLSYSATSFAATASKAFDNVKQIGGKTGGGMGLPVGGTMPNGWTYRFSGNVVMDYRADSYTDNGYNYEKGVPPDIEQDDDPVTDANDEIIDRAILWLDSAEAAVFTD